MAVTVVQTTPESSNRLVDQVSAMRSAMANRGVDLIDMSRAGSLESGIGLEEPTAGASPPEAPIDIVRLESSTISQRELAPAAEGKSAFRFFLDGSQKTIPVCRIGLHPIVVGLSAAGVLVRDDSGQPRLVGDALRVGQFWIAPTRTNHPQLNQFLDEIRISGGSVEDPLETNDGDPVDGYSGIAGNYGRSLSAAFEHAGKLRARQEQILIEQWQTSMSASNPADWIVIDGPLRGNVPNAIGLVKNLQTQQLTHDEALTLFDLPQGFRTTAFRYASSGADPERDATEGKTMWYMRLWSPAGMDARHSLVRIEAAHDVETTDQIDEISSWILAERLPRATADPRWPTLLYPIHYLERILKRRLAELTAGWPST